MLTEYSTDLVRYSVDSLPTTEVLAGPEVLYG